MPIVTQFDPPCASKNDWNDEETRRRIAALAGFNEGYSLQVGNIFLGVAPAKPDTPSFAMNG